MNGVSPKYFSSQSTIKMEKGYYYSYTPSFFVTTLSQSTIKMEKGYYARIIVSKKIRMKSQSTIKMEKGYYPTAMILVYHTS